RAIVQPAAGAQAAGATEPLGRIAVESVEPAERAVHVVDRFSSPARDELGAAAVALAANLLQLGARPPNRDPFQDDDRREQHGGQRQHTNRNHSSSWSDRHYLSDG